MMEKVLFVFFCTLSIIISFDVAFIAAPWGMIEITIPAKAVGTVMGVFVFFIALIFWLMFFNLVSDILFYRTARSTLWIVISEGWYDWRFILPISIVTAVSCYLLGPLFGVAAGAFVLVIFITAAYLYVKIGVMNSIGNAFYSNRP